MTENQDRPYCERQRRTRDLIKGAIFDAGDILYHRKRNEVETLFWALERNGWGKRQEYLDNKDVFDDLRELSYRGIITRKETVIAFLKALGIHDEAQRNSTFASYEEEYQVNMTFPQEVPEVVNGLKAMGMKLIVLSDGHCSGLEKKRWLARVGIDNKFEDVLCSCDIGYRKPERRAYEITLERLSMDAAETVFVGHSLKDLGGAMNLDIMTVGVGCPDADSGLVNVRLSELSELPRAIRELKR